MCGLEGSRVLSCPASPWPWLQNLEATKGLWQRLAHPAPCFKVGNWKAFRLHRQNPQNLPCLWAPRAGKFVLRAVWGPVDSVASLGRGLCYYFQGLQTLPPSTRGVRTYALSSSGCQSLYQAPCIHVSQTPLCLVSSVNGDPNGVRFLGWW